VVYVYFIYGMYEMLNFVCEREGDPGAVLIRAIEPLTGEEFMRKRRKVSDRRQLTNGPGKLTVAFDIRMSDNGRDLGTPDFYVCDDGYRPAKVAVSPRIGISQGLEKDWRYFEDGNSFVSKGPSR
jgi:DNA-3-methyladenine glycosylase